MERKEKIVVIGGGFAGLNLVKRLDKRKFDVTLVDRNNYHSFPPLFYQVASSGLDPASISFPFRREMRKSRVRGTRFNMGEVKHIDPVRHTVTTEFETIGYDKLVIAVGTTNNFFDMPQLHRSAYTLKSTPEALRCRNEILDRLERAAITHDTAKRRRLLSFVVIGGGPAGVEIAGALGEMKRYILRREYPTVSLDDMSITLLEGGDMLLRAMSAKASAEARRYLTDLMVDVRTGIVMTGYDNDVVTLSDGSTIYSGMVIWTAGVTGAPVDIAGDAVKRGAGNRIVVDACNRVEGVDDIFAVGDIALMTSDPDFPHGHPQLAQVAIQQARTLACNLNDGRCDRIFRYRDKGTMATVGRNRAVADLRHFHLSGYPAWAVWMLVHLVSILGMRNKVTVLVNWLWAYFTYGTSLRLLIHPTRYPLRERWGEHRSSSKD